MMNLIQKFFTTEKSDKSKLRADFVQFFFSQPEHAWILGTLAEGHFRRLFDRLPSGVLTAMLRKYPVTFVQSELLEHRDFQNGVCNTVVVFPEFQRLLNSKKSSAEAYLAHELAFVLYEHEGNRSDPLLAEVEADKFVCDIGLTFELEELLLLLDETVEKRLRLTYLTAYHFSTESN